MQREFYGILCHQSVAFVFVKWDFFYALQIPPPPGVKESVEGFEFVEASSGSSSMSGDRDEQYKKLEQDLIQQIRVSEREISISS